jgi:hypothetical protein
MYWLGRQKFWPSAILRRWPLQILFTCFAQARQHSRRYITPGLLRPTLSCYAFTKHSLPSFLSTGGYAWSCAGLLRMTNWKGTGWLAHLPSGPAVGMLLICRLALIASSLQHSRRTTHADGLFTSGNWTTTLPEHAMTCKSVPRAFPWTGWHISTRYPNPPLRSTILSGPPQSPWKKTSGVIRHGVLFSCDGPLPRLFS